MVIIRTLTQPNRQGIPVPSNSNQKVPSEPPPAQNANADMCIPNETIQRPRMLSRKREARMPMCQTHASNPFQ
jgi:hypothetical protein